MRKEDPIFAQTMIRTKARLSRGEGEATATEGVDTKDEIDRFTLGLEDILVSPS